MFILIVGLNVKHSSMICQVIYFGKIYGRGGVDYAHYYYFYLHSYVFSTLGHMHGLLLSLRVSNCFCRKGADLELFTTMKLV